jgi:hypothetical protein
VGEEANMLRGPGDCLGVGIEEIYDYNYYSIFSIFWDNYGLFPVQR